MDGAPPAPECGDVPYDLELDRVREALSRARRAGRRPLIVVQLPDGLKPLAARVAECVEEATGAEVVVHGDSTYGACDLAWSSLEPLNPDLVVHYGHTPYPPWLADARLLGRGRFLFLPARSRLPLPREALLEAAEALRRRGAKRLALAASVQHAHLLPEAAEALASRGFEAVVPRGRPPYFLDGQVLGCDYSVALSAGADAYIFIGGGVFHPLGLYLASRRPVARVDPYRGSWEDLTGLGEKTLRVRLYKVSQAMDARRWGVIVGLREGQHRPWLVERLRRELEGSGAKVRLIAMERTYRESLASIDSPWFEAFAVTSCPRIPIDDLSDYPKPVLTPGEAFMAARRVLEPYRFPW